jgi:hypothetical protein
VFHVELRQFPHNFCRFNMSEQELRRSVLDAWARKEWLEFGERKWDPNQATVTVIEGPRLSMPELSMGRGWRNAQRAGTDVTERMLEAARAAQEPAQAAAPPAPAEEELVALLGPDPEPLLRAWRLAMESHPDRRPSECLALAEEFVRG